MAKDVAESNVKYHRAKIWQIGLFTFNNTATNTYLFTLGFLSYYAAGIAGVAVLLISTILGAIRIFDGLIDPPIGALIDKLETRFGKYRPLMIAGNAIMALSYLLIFSTHTLPEGARVAFLVVALLINKVGFSLQNSVTKAAQTVLTNDPKQRPVYTIFDSIYNFGVYGGGQIFVASYLFVKHGDFTMSFFKEFITIGMIISAVLTIFAVIGISAKDRKEFYGLGEETVETKGFREYWKVIKGNRPLIMLTIAAAADKVASQTKNQSVVLVMLFGILLGDYAMSGKLSAMLIFPTIILTFLVTAFATRKGLKKAYVGSVWAAIISYSLMLAIVLMVDPAIISFDNIGFIAATFFFLYLVGSAFVALPTTLVVPMIADVSDYETAKSGRYVAGMMGNIFSMIDQLVSSLAPVIVGIVVALVGFKEQFPTVNDPLTTPLFFATITLAFIIPIALLLVSLICMKFYPLDKVTMEQVQKTISEKKEAGQLKEVEEQAG